MFENKFNTKKTDPLVEAVMQAQQDGEMRRQAIAMVNEQFGVFNRNAVVRENLAAYDAAIEEAYKCMKEGKPLADKDYDKDGKIESPKDEVWGSRLRAAKMAGKLKEEEQIDEISRGLALKASRAADKRASEIHRADGGKWVGSGEFKSIPGQHYSAGLAQQAVKHYNKKSEKFKAYANKKTPDFEHNVETLKKYASPAVVRKLAKEETDYFAQDRAPVTKSAPKEDPSTPKSYPGAASTVSGPNPTSQRMSNAVKPKLQEAVSRKHFQQVADLIKGHDSQEKRNELASHHAGIFAKQNPRFNAAKFHAAAGSTAHQEPKKMDEAKYSYKSAHRGEDITKRGKMFGKIAKKAGERYGSEERGKKVAGAILAKIRAKHMKEAIQTTLRPTPVGSQAKIASTRNVKGNADPGRWENQAKSMTGSMQQKRGGKMLPPSSQLGTPKGGESSTQSFLNKQLGRTTANPAGPPAPTSASATPKPPAASKALGGTKWADQGARERASSAASQAATMKSAGDTPSVQTGTAAPKAAPTPPSRPSDLGKTTANVPTPPSRPTELDIPKIDKGPAAGPASMPNPKVSAPTPPASSERPAPAPMQNPDQNRTKVMKESVQIGENKYRIV